MSERSEEDVVAGVLRIPVGGIIKMVPTLKAKYIAEWSQLLVTTDPTARPPAEWSMGDVADLSGETVERLIDLAVGYDRTGALGGRDWLMENADPQQLHAAVVQMVGNAYPLAADPAGFLGLMLLVRPGKSAPPNSPNGASRNGASTRTRSGRGSTRSK